MTRTDATAVTTVVEVGVDPRAAFDIFTDEIDRWWRPGPINWYDSARAIGIRFEPGVGGRWIEIYDEDGDDVLEIGRIGAWEPGARLTIEYLDGGYENAGTEVEVRFEPVDDGTKVTLEHRGWDAVPPDVAERNRQTKRRGWAGVLGWYKEWAFWGSPRRVRAQDRAAG